VALPEDDVVEIERERETKMQPALVGILLLY
jgi:hypothetical protein